MPVAFLHLEIPPEEVDVNVHPTKVEVRFRDGQRIYSQLLSTVRQTFLASDLHSRLQAPSRPPAAGRRPSRRDGARRRPFALAEAPADRQDGRLVVLAEHAAPASSRSRRPATRAARPSRTGRAAAATSRRRRAGRSTFDEFAAAAGALADPPATPPAEPVAATPRRPRPRSPDAGDVPLKAIQVHDSYLIAETDDGMMVIDQHALHERILYEELTVAGRAGGRRVAAAARPRAGRPDRGRGGRGPRAARGPGAARAGGRAVRRRHGAGRERPGDAPRASPPTGSSATWPTTSGRSPLPPTRDALLADLLHMVACKAAVKAGQRLTPEEIAALLERRHLVADSHHCPHGRPTALVFTKSELERQFGRI